jgi:hypothetical protein
MVKSSCSVDSRFPRHDTLLSPQGTAQQLKNLTASHSLTDLGVSETGLRECENEVVQALSNDGHPNAAGQQRDRRQACLPTGLAAAFAGCEARSAEQPADDHPLLFAD